jgi:mono/diheme cytochrome c family protein
MQGRPPTRLAVTLLMLVAGVAPAWGDAPAPGVDYLRDVKPLLAARCVSCHGPEKPRAGLRLDTAAAAIRGGTSGPAVVPGAPDESELILAVRGEGVGERMPLKRPPLSEAEVATLRAWVAAGARFPADERPSPPAATHWAFVPPTRPAVPAVAGEGWVRNPIDPFVLAPLERDGIAPSPEADRPTLLRRLALDLVGLPPTPEEVAAFAADARPDAYERQVDRLLASPHFGERWGRLWLDAARYADSNGYSIDAPRQIWAYRDWVIRALNADRPFDEFTVDQLAGDLRDGATLEQRVATGFHRNTQVNQEGGIDPEQFRVEAVMDRVNTTATVWLGLTLACAQCHDHKYDPLSQKEYYGLFAFFNNADEPTLPLATPEQNAARERAERAADAYLRSIERDPALLALQRAWEESLDTAGRQKQTQEVREAFNAVFAARSAEANRVVFAAFVEQSREKAVAPHRRRLAAIRKDAPAPPTTLVVQERKAPRATRFLMGGDYTRPGDEVGPLTPAVLNRFEAPSERRPDRMDLARWLVDRSNPLTARVQVNRLWQAYFGRGIVETDGDLGTQGAPPSHPELLDWLAVELMERGWSLKAVHRLIVTSAAYRQASRARPDLAAIDPDNRRLARQSRLRLEAELIRDVALVAGGRLVPEIGGPSVFPPQPDGVMNLGQIRREWKADAGPNRYRRGMYTYFWRATPHPLFTVFDAPDGMRTCTRRLRSNTPLQALTLLNDAAFVELARDLAGRVLEGDASDAERLDRAFRLTLSRPPQPGEAARLRALLDSERDAYRDDAEGARAVAPPAPVAIDLSARAAWTSVARVLLNLDEFITRE